MMIPSQEKFTRLSDISDFLIDDKMGIINFLGELPRESGSPEFFHYYTQVCDTSAFVNQKNFSNAGGASTDRQKAMAKAIGEGVERYCSAIFQQEDCPLANADSASFPCIQPEDFALYSPQQYLLPGFPFVPFTKFTPIRWTPSFNPLTGNTWYVPACMVFIPYAYQKEIGEQQIVQPISTGLACHCSWEEAASSAIAEIIERDAFTITWQAKLSPPRVETQSLSFQNRDIIRRFEVTGHSVDVFYLSLDHGIPTILSVLQHSNPEIPAMVFAASTHLDPESAVRGSLEELAHTRRMATNLKNTRPPISPNPDHKNIVDQDGHVQLYCDQSNFHLAQFILGSEPTLDFQNIPNLSTGSPQQDLQIYLKRIEGTQHQVLLKDLTTPDIEDLGLKVVRALIPGFHPLFLGHAIRALGGRRLWEVPQKMGWEGISIETGDNPFAHPFP